MYGGKYFYDTSLSVFVEDILQNVSQPCPGSQEGQPHPGGVSSRVREDCPALLWGSLTSSAGAVLSTIIPKTSSCSEAVQRRPWGW